MINILFIQIFIIKCFPLSKYKKKFTFYKDYYFHFFLFHSF